MGGAESSRAPLVAIETGRDAILCRRQPEAAPSATAPAADRSTVGGPSPDHGQASPEAARPDPASAHRSSARPHARPATQPAAVTPVAAPRPDTLTDAEEARAAELEAAIVAEEKAGRGRQEAATRAATVDADPVRAGVEPRDPAAEEYAYVARDVRRIAIVGGR